MMARARGVLLLLAMLAASGCAREASGGPPPMRYGEHSCSQCGMLISEPRFAAAASGGEPARFDDMGCLVRYRMLHPGQELHYWVQAYQGDGWLDAEEAFFVHDKTRVTPMGWGIIAVTTGEEAARLAAAGQGKSLRFDGLPQAVADGNRQQGFELDGR